MKNERFFIIALVLLVIGSGANVLAMHSSPDATLVNSDCDHVMVNDVHELLSGYLEQEKSSFTEKVLVGSSYGSTKCDRCGGTGKVPCWNKFCMYKTNGIGCGYCDNTGSRPCPKCRGK